MRYLTFAALAAALLIPNAAFAQKGGGHGGGGHGGGGGHAVASGGASHGGGGTWHGGTTAWHGGTWNGGNWNGGHWNGNWNGGHWNGNWNGGHWHNSFWYPWGAFGLGYGLGWGWGGYGWGWPYYYSSPNYYYTYDYPTYYASPSYAYPNTSYYDSYPRDSSYYDALASGAPSTPSISPYRAKLELVVPDSNAQIIVEGQRMNGLGTRRFFVSPELDPSKNYSYTITMRTNNAGRPEEDTREVIVQAGMLKRINFTQPVVRSLPAPRTGGGIISTTPPQAVPPK